MRKGLLGLILILTACAPAGGAVAGGETATSVTIAPTTMVPTTASPTTTSTTVTTTATPTTTTTTTTTLPPPNEVFAWMPGGLTDDFPDIVATIPGVVDAGVITSVTMHLVISHKADGTVVDQPPPRFVIPMHGALVDRADVAPIFGLPAIDPDEIILGEGSAALRRLDVGDTITFEKGDTLRVGAIVAEDLMAGYEAIAVEPDHFVADRMQPRAILVLYEETSYQLDLEIKERIDPDLIYAVGGRESSADNGGLMVRSQVFIKQHFGEFAYRPTGNGRFQIDPAWVDANIVDVTIPLLGPTKCHRLMADILTDIMRDLVDNGLNVVIDQGAFAGCWNSRYIADSYRMSRHSFGAAADINIFNPTDGGPGSPVNPELLSRIYAAGLTSGHVWANADPGHFEFFND